MYSQDPNIRRRRLKLRFFYYGIMTFSIIALTIIGVFFVLGYRISLQQNTVNVSRGGLLKFNTQPQNATIYFDGTRLAINTPHQVNIASGEHEVSYSKEGYQTWQKDITMHPGELLLLNYARLIPNSITTTSIRNLPGLHQVIASPDREWLVLHEAADSPMFTLTDARNERDIKFTTLALAEAVYTKRPNIANTFQVMAWSGDSKFILIKHTNGEITEYIRVPRDDQARAVNLTKVFGMTLTNMQFSANNPNVLYGTDEKNSLFRLDVTNPTVKTKIADGVLQYDNFNDNKVAFIAPTADKAKKDNVLYAWQQGRAAKSIKTIPVGQQTTLAYNGYLSKEYLAVTIGANLMVYEDPFNSNIKTLQNTMLAFTPTALVVSPGGRFVMAQAGESIINYDIELKKNYAFQSPGETRQPLQWVDDHHLVLTGANNARFMEFDGTNVQQVTQIAPGSFDSLIGIDGRVFLSIGHNSASGALELQQSQLLTEADQNAGLF